MNLKVQTLGRPLSLARLRIVRSGFSMFQEFMALRLGSYPLFSEENLEITFAFKHWCWVWSQQMLSNPICVLSKETSLILPWERKATRAFDPKNRLNQVAKEPLLYCCYTKNFGRFRQILGDFSQLFANPPAWVRCIIRHLLQS